MLGAFCWFGKEIQLLRYLYSRDMTLSVLRKVCRVL